jgi:hypothetical protein
LKILENGNNGAFCYDDKIGHSDADGCLQKLDYQQQYYSDKASYTINLSVI